jgi:hypothetical protein
VISRLIAEANREFEEYAGQGNEAGRAFHRLLGLKRVSDARNAIGNVMRMAEHSTSTLPLDLTDLTNARFDENGLIQGRTFSVWEVTSGGFRDARIVASSAESTNRHNMRRSAARTLVSQFRPPVAQ